MRREAVVVLVLIGVVLLPMWYVALQGEPPAREIEIDQSVSTIHPLEGFLPTPTKLSPSQVGVFVWWALFALVGVVAAAHRFMNRMVRPPDGRPTTDGGTERQYPWFETDDRWIAEYRPASEATEGIVVMGALTVVAIAFAALFTGEYLGFARTQYFGVYAAGMFLALAEREVDERVVTALAAVARTDDDADVRQFAVESLAKLGADAASDVARDLLRGDDDPWVRAEAMVSLDRLDREAHLDVVRERVDDDHHAVRRNALISLFKATGTEALPTLLSAADDDSERVREWAVHMLGGIDDERATATLERHAARDASRIVRETARNALDVDADRFRRRFSGTGAGEEVTHRGEDFLNRTPDL